jgi:hypothetical protein
VRAGLVALVVVVLVAAGCGGGSSPAPGSAGVVPTVRSALVARLHAKGIGYRWVACLRNGRSFRGREIVRCNVNFGDPHIEAYCGVLVRGRLQTNHENRAIPCHRDRAGFHISVTGS